MPIKMFDKKFEKDAMVYGFISRPIKTKHGIVDKTFAICYKKDEEKGWFEYEIPAFDLQPVE